MRRLYNKKSIAFICVFCISAFSIAQTFSNTSSEKNNSSEQQNLLNTQLNLGVTVLVPVNASSNSVFINQIGDRNQSEINVSSNNAISSINQLGNDNNSYISLNSNGLGLLVLQLGDNNSTQYQNVFREELISTNITQQGTNQNLEINGTNGLMENMKVLMRGNSQSVLIRNFK